MDIDIVKESFEKVLNKTRCEYKSEIKNFGQCIEISNKDFVFDLDENCLFIWIRTLGNRVEIATINLPESIRRIGILTEIINNLKEISSINEIAITGVSTEPMKNFCMKHGFISTNGYDFVLKK